MTRLYLVSIALSLSTLSGCYIPAAYDEGFDPVVDTPHAEAPLVAASADAPQVRKGSARMVEVTLESLTVEGAVDEIGSGGDLEIFGDVEVSGVSLLSLGLFEWVRIAQGETYPVVGTIASVMLPLSVEPGAAVEIWIDLYENDSAGVESFAPVALSLGLGDGRQVLPVELVTEVGGARVRVTLTVRGVPSTVAGGGWELVSARQENQGVLFGDETCPSPTLSCSGRLRYPDACEPEDGRLLLSTPGGESWLMVESNKVLHDFLTRRRELVAENHCNAPHFCEVLPKPLRVIAHSSNFEPVSEYVTSLWVMSGGLALRAPDGRVIAALNLAPYDHAGGAFYMSGKGGSVVVGAPGALFYRCGVPLN